MRYFIFIIILLYQTVQAQQPVHQIINTKNGLPSKTVYDIYQDKNGFIWMTHEKGISRYDGKHIKNYISTTSQGKASTSIQESKDGQIWFVNFDGNVFYTSAFQDSIYEQKLLYTKNNWSKIYYYNNEIIKPSNKEILKLNLETNTISRVANTNKVIGYCSTSMQNDELIFSSYTSPNSINELWVYKNGKTFSIPISKKIASLNYSNTYGPIHAKDNYWLIKPNKGFTFINVSTGESKFISTHSDDFLINYYTLQNNIFWICTTNGLYAFDENLNPIFNNKPLFPNYSITSVLNDREGNLWLSTINDGIIKIPSINLIVHNIANEGITSIAYHSKLNTIILGSIHNQILNWNYKNTNTQKIFDAHQNKEISNLVCNPERNELHFTSDKSYIYHLNSKHITELKAYIKDYYYIENNCYALATPFGYGFNQVPKNFSWNFTNKNGKESGFYALQKDYVRTRCVAYNNANATFYAGTINGLLQVNNLQCDEIKNQNTSIIASDLMVLNNYLFAGTLNDGLFQIQNKKVIHAFTNTNGLLSNSIIKLKIIDNMLWILSDKGLQQFNYAENKFYNYSFANILSNEEIADFEIMDGKIFLASTSGVIEMPIQKNITSNTKPLIWIDKFYCDKVNYKFEEATVFEAGNHLIEIFLTLPNFRNTNDVNIYYQVNQSNWQKLADGEQGLTLPQLSSGNYKVKFKAECNGLSSNELPEVNFSIQTPWYFSWWFLIGCAILLISIAYFIVKNEFKKQRIKQQFETEKNKLEKELQQSTLASIKSQMNPHFLFNALNTIQSYIYQNDKQNASQYLGKFSELTRMILEMSNREKVSLTEEIKALKLYLELEQLRFEEKLKYEIFISKNVDEEMIHIPSMLIQPYLENAIKHGLLHKKDNWLLHVLFEKNEHTLIVKIDDNGIGRKRSQELQKLKLKQHQSFAMSANEKRLDILNKGLQKPIALQIVDKINESGDATGTTIVLHIPILSTASKTN